MMANPSQGSPGGAYVPSPSDALNPLSPGLQLVQSRVSFQFWGSPVYTASDGTYWCPGFDGPTFATSPWDYIKIAIPYGPYSGGVPPDRTPGICKVRLKKEYAVDKKKPLGSHGARITVHGLDIAEIDIEIKVWTPEQLRQLAQLWVTLFPPATKGAPLTFDAQHPTFSVHDVKSIQFISGDGPEVQNDRSGIFKIRALEFLKPQTTNATSTAVQVLGSILDPGGAPTPGSNSANLAPR